MKTEKQRYFEQRRNTSIDDLSFKSSDETEPPPLEDGYKIIRDHMAKTKYEIPEIDLPMAQPGGKSSGSFYSDEIEPPTEWIDEDHEPYDDKNSMAAPYEFVKKPSHYIWFDIETIDVIEKTLTHEQFKGFLMGTSMRYRFRCGSKPGEPLERDINKAKQYEEYWYEYVKRNTQ